MINEILLRRKNKVVIEGKTDSNLDSFQQVQSRNLVLTMMKNIQSLGYTFSEELFKSLSEIKKDDLDTIYIEIVNCLKTLCGADKVYEPMYPNFPHQVIEADDAELFINALVHYWSFGEMVPVYTKEKREPLMMISDPDYIVLDTGNYDELWEIFGNLLSSKKSISEIDKRDIETIIRSDKEYIKHIPEEIPLKENVALLCGIVKETEAGKTKENIIKKHFKTATDVLRFITHLSDGDISLSENTLYKKLKRSDRKLIMDLLASCGKNIEEDMFRYKNKWIRIGEIIHPSEFKNEKYENVRAAFDSIRSGEKPLFFNGQVQKYINESNFKDAAKLLSKRPGEFARRLDELLRKTTNPSYTVNMFQSVADKVSTNVLLDIRQHFINRDKIKKRIIIPKGNTSKAYSIEKTGFIPEYIINDIVSICEDVIIERNREKDYMGSVYIDDSFKKIIAPFSQRSANTTSKALERGSRIKISDGTGVIRSFIWWTNLPEDTNKLDCRVDLDLSVSFFDDQWNFIEWVDWRRLRSESAFHSGDITNGGDVDSKGASEFIDLDLEKLKDNYKYVVFTVHSYTHQKFSEMENARFGWMERYEMNSGEIFEPKTVKMNMDVRSGSIVVIPSIFDVENREFIWCDLSTNRVAFTSNTITDNLSGVIASCYAAANINKISLYDLIFLNIRARGMLTKNRNCADIIFDNNTTKPVIELVSESGETIKEKLDTPIITAFDTEYYMSNLM